MKFTTRELVLMPLFTALMVVGAKLSIPFPGVPLTFQLFFCVFAGLLLGARNGFISQLLYIVMGLIGLPVFSKGGGPQYIFNPTFGYVIGFALCALILGYLVERSKEAKFVKLLGISLIGFVVIYLFGNIYFYVIMNAYLGKAMPLLAVFKMMIPYMIKDLVLLVIAVYSSTIILPTLRKAGIHRVQKVATEAK